MKSTLTSIVTVFAVSMMAVTGCSQKSEESQPANASVPATPGSQPPTGEARAPSEPLIPGPPATLTDVNVVAADMGGAVEELTGNFGTGLTGRWLIDGAVDPVWTAPGRYGLRVSGRREEESLRV
jgi:hypothetical protein